ncbi:hypothetical protein ABH912_005395 [Pseudomonas sp. BT76 TE3572]|uniref:Uncharacterized protein n=1 Tax=Pseudomonas mandelii PD30 TaxID=1419583 RepID=A0A059KWT3_9PSED|nr:hypothetical protein V466_25695 [Pseudomonas mandelii PD30]
MGMAIFSTSHALKPVSGDCGELMNRQAMVLTPLYRHLGV